MRKGLRKVKNLLSQAQVTRNEIGEILVYDFNTLADKRNKTNASEYKSKALWAVSCQSKTD